MYDIDSPPEDSSSSSLTARHIEYRPKFPRLTVLLCASCLTMQGFTPAQADYRTIEELKSLSLEQLAQQEVSIASNIPHSLAKSAAAVYVLTQEDIRRSGATTIPEVLRLVPGVQVAHINGNSWAISARGFNDSFSNKLLVVMDGRSVYTPLFSGVYWDVQDTLLEDIERIEVIRGPGAAVWGANAVNGVINIITKSAYESRGGLLSAGVGNEERWNVGGRFGGDLGEIGAYRIYAKGFKRDGAQASDGSDGEDQWDARRFGFRTDLDAGAADRLTVQGDAYDGNSGQSLDIVGAPTTIAEEQELYGGNLLVRWSHLSGAFDEYQLQAYYDRASRKDVSLDRNIETLDVAFRHKLSLGARQKLAWGLGYRRIEDELPIGSLGIVSVDPVARGYDIKSVFIEDAIDVVRDTLRFSVGAKLEDNDFTGSDLQPDLRLLWTVDEHQVFWTSWSRAVRTPSRVESDLSITLPAVTVSGNPQPKAETVNAYEAGYRLQAHERLAIDIAIYHNDYDNLATLDTQGFTSPPQPPVQVSLGNGASAQGQGLELVANWEARRNWRLRLAYSYLDIDVETLRSGSATSAGDNYPPHQLVLRSLLDLGDAWELDTYLYYVDSLKNNPVDAYTRIDVRLGWHGRQGWEASLALQNLLDERHPEFVPGESTSLVGLLPSEVQRSVFVKLTKRF